ncbi:MAG: hypothetical protein OSB69_22110, partial [Alphaproteobacteria bacterium]|nr:hypothetical protein [Alphaproteobacteria bacterium]
MVRVGHRFTDYAFLLGLCWSALASMLFETTAPFISIYMFCAVVGLLVDTLIATSALASVHRTYGIAVVLP